MSDASPSPASGPRHTIENGRVRAVIGSVAAVICEVRVDGERITETVPLEGPTPQGCGMVLAPWPNRVRDARWTLDGETMLLDVTEATRPNAIHGLLRNTAYRVIERSADAIELGALIAPQHGWPFTIDTRVRYRLLERGMEVTHTATNLGDGPAPWAVGAHPYLRIGETPTEELRLVVSARTRLIDDDLQIPIGREPLDGTDADLRVPRSLAGMNVDTTYGELSPGPDGAVAWLVDGRGRRTVLCVDEAFRWVQVYTPQDHPTAEGPRPAIALEPMTAPPDALNSGTDLIELRPGRSWSGSWIIRVEDEAA